MRVGRQITETCLKFTLVCVCVEVGTIYVTNLKEQKSEMVNTFSFFGGGGNIYDQQDLTIHHNHN